jgi:hypothetical protein
MVGRKKNWKCKEGSRIFPIAYLAWKVSANGRIGGRIITQLNRKPLIFPKICDRWPSTPPNATRSDGRIIIWSIAPSGFIKAIAIATNKTGLTRSASSRVASEFYPC